jgi:plasmid stability protein
MANLIIPDLDDGLLERLRKRSDLSKRSLEDEIRAILASAAPPQFTPQERRESADHIRKMTRWDGLNSTDLIREDRDSR